MGIRIRRKCMICHCDKPDVPASRVHPQCQKMVDAAQAVAAKARAKAQEEAEKKDDKDEH